MLSTFHSRMLVLDALCYVYFVYRAKLHHNAAAVHIPIGLEAQHKGVVDIINQKAYYFEGRLGYVVYSIVGILL